MITESFSQCAVISIIDMNAIITVTALKHLPIIFFIAFITITIFPTVNSTKSKKI